MFELAWESLSTEIGPMGRIALTPWDCKAFGFNVAQFEALGISVFSCDALAKSLEQWSAGSGAELVSTRVSLDDSVFCLKLQRAGFRFCEMAQDAVYDVCEIAPAEAVTLELADATGVEGIAAMAGCSFRHGRYHADPRFPNALADARYRQWVLNATNEPEGKHEVLSANHNGCRVGFVCLKYESASVARVTLIAISNEFRGKGMGRGVMRGCLVRCFSRGVQTLRTRISAGNFAAVRLHVTMGARLEIPDLVLHRHSANASHLLEVGEETKPGGCSL